MRFRKLMQLLKHHFRKLTQLLKMGKLMKFLHNNFRRLMKLNKLLEKYLRKLTKQKAFSGERFFKSSTAETISRSEVDVTNIMGELQFDEQEIVLESDMGNIPVSLKNPDMHDVAKALGTHMLSENTTTEESDEDELAGNQAGFDLNMEEFSSDFNANVFEDSQMENDGTIPSTQVQNVQRNILHEQSIPSVDHMSADPETSGYVKRHSYQKDGKTKKKRKLLMIKLLQKVMLIDAWSSPSR
jgi:hypothetical protein